jgi:hypothetical protein
MRGSKSQNYHHSLVVIFRFRATEFAPHEFLKVLFCEGFGTIRGDAYSERVAVSSTNYYLLTRAMLICEDSCSVQRTECQCPRILLAIYLS